MHTNKQPIHTHIYTYGHCRGYNWPRPNEDFSQEPLQWEANMITAQWAMRLDTVLVTWKHLSYNTEHVFYLKQLFYLDIIKLHRCSQGCDVDLNSKMFLFQQDAIKVKGDLERELWVWRPGFLWVAVGHVIVSPERWSSWGEMTVNSCCRYRLVILSFTPCIIIG